jgi:acyl-CoA thioesterase-2
MSDAEAHPQTPEGVIAEFVRTLDVAPHGNDHFVGDPDPHDREHDRLFGGLVLAQAAIAAGRTVEERRLHSLHAYFLRPGRADTPIEYDVERTRDGRTFVSRRVLAHQGAEPICDISMSFARDEEGIAHQDPMPPAPPPEQARDAGEFWPDENDRLWPFELRFVTPPDTAAKPGESTLSMAWQRPIARLPDDPVIHAAALIFHSDAGSFAGIDRRYERGDMYFPGSASLDHAVWLHRPLRWDGWLLFVTDTPVAHSARALTYRTMYDEAGAHVASMAQEAVFRRRRT